MRILIVDDDPVVSRLLKDFLTLKGFYVQTSDNGSEALELIKREGFQVLVTDYDMPGLNGIELTGIVRSLCQDLLIVGMSADSKEPDFLKAGADLFIQKPFSLFKLSELISDLFLKNHAE
jgi:DNA-binding response OmpR family regulator